MPCQATTSRSGPERRRPRSRFLAGVAPRGGLVVLVSDFRGRAASTDWLTALAAVAARSQVLVVEIRDRREDELPDVGDLTLFDTETGREVRVDTSSRALRERFARAAADDRAAPGARPSPARRRPRRPVHVGQLAQVARFPAPPPEDRVMTFASPELLVGLLLVPLAIAAYLFVQRRRARYAVAFTNVDLLANLVPRTPAWRRHVPAALYLGAIGALVLALARPSMILAVPREEATIILTMDVSGSMKATDVAPTRLAAAQKAASDFVDQLPDSFQVGLVVFSTTPRVAVSPTTDRVALHKALDALVADGGTALGDAIATSLEAASATPATGPTTAPSPDPSADPSADPSPSGPDEPPLVATVLLSDGANSTGLLEPLDAADRAAALGVPIYTIALGTQDGVVQVPNREGQLQTLEVPPDTDTLAAIAETTGARFFDAPTAQDLAQIYENLGSRVGFTDEQREVTQLFAAAGLLFVLAGAGLAAHWFNRFP